MEMQALGLGRSRARLQHPPAEQQELLQPCLLPAVRLPPPDPGLGPRHSGSSRSRVTAQASAHPAVSQKAPLPGSSPQHMVNTLLIITAVNSTSLLPEPRLALARARSRLGWHSAAPTHPGLLRSPVPCPGCPCPSEQLSPARTPVWHLPTAHQRWHR